MWKSTDGETPAFETATFLMHILTLTNYQINQYNSWLFYFSHFFCLWKYQVLIKFATFVWGFQLSKVTSPTAINFFVRVSNTAQISYIFVENINPFTKTSPKTVKVEHIWQEVPWNRIECFLKINKHEETLRIVFLYIMHNIINKSCILSNEPPTYTTSLLFRY